MNKSLHKNHSYLFNLIAIAKIDNIIHHREKGFIYKRGEELGFTVEEIDNLVIFAGDIDFTSPASREDKLLYLEDAVSMAYIDGKVTIAEFRKCLETCKMLELEEELLYELFKKKNIDLYAK